MVKQVNWQPLLKCIFLSLFLVFTVFPLYWIFITSLKPSNDMFTIPIHYWPKTITFDNYINIFKISNFGVYIFNSLILSVVAGFCSLIIASLSGYVLARFEFKGKAQVIFAFFITQMIPLFIGLAPLYLLMSKLQLLNRLPSLMLMYTVMMVPFCTVIMKGFFERIPSSLEEAAMIDGCSRITALFKVIVPVMLPGIAATFIFAFVQCWNELFLAIMFIDKEEAKTIPVAMNAFITKYDIDWGSMSAATVISVIPTLILFAFAQRYIVEGMTQGSVKG
ncbi:carbohydrate ABC transporter permease [Neobacillus ginsengisoli]|uniref:Multiple sugar transport system permease protein n=1 Tax=Neobacillus ginsengisoli TaxID=904295 RepID=A0ABT9XXJ3_9BACI|nr:carbohydrate ABC transporter permease [Neobacillus ginsengisoli]MDQ0200300.1 multiple sugar transport system permease protein [Neobacillus ginsengisoli]